MSATKCVLRCAEDSHDPILLEHDKVVVVGRGPDTRIKESRCSRHQVKLKADYSKYEVAITQVGRNACALNSVATSKEVPVKAKHGDKLQILLGMFTNVIEFDPPPVMKEEENSNSKGVNRLSVSDSEPESGPVAKKAKTGGSVTDEACNGVSSTCWESLDSGQLLIYTPEGVKASSYIAAYDMDGTLIVTKSGAVFPKNKDDWKVAYPQVPAKLKELYNAKYKLLLFTNQAGISCGKQKVNDFKAKVEAVVRKLGVPVQVFVATGNSKYRKPCTGMWEVAMERNSITVDTNQSLYCGDAAGREAAEGRKKDFAQTDLAFSRNIGIKFQTPEHHFLKKKQPQLEVKVFNPKAIPCDIPLCEPAWGQVLSIKTELIVLVGSPGSGKSTFAKTHLVPAGYAYVSRDVLGSWTRCVAAVETALKSRQKVVVDNTNPDVESRKRYIEVAKSFTSIVRCFIMNTGFQHARHNIRFRQLTERGHQVTDVVLNTYNSKYEEPTTAEGFTEILKINFWPTFKDPELEKLYNMFLLEK